MSVANKVNEAVQHTLDSLVAQGREIGVQVSAWVGEEQVVDCWAGVADPGTGRLVDGDTARAVRDRLRPRPAIGVGSTATVTSWGRIWPRALISDTSGSVAAPAERWPRRRT